MAAFQKFTVPMSEGHAEYSVDQLAVVSWQRNAREQGADDVILKLDEMVRGWFVGGFKLTAFHTDACEVGVKSYKAGDAEDRHYHKVATEITLIQSGRVLMNGIEYQAGDIIVTQALEDTDFQALDDSVTVVVKVPGAKDDKFLGQAGSLQ